MFASRSSSRATARTRRAMGRVKQNVAPVSARSVQMRPPWASTRPFAMFIEFEKSIDDYLEFCNSIGKEPQKPFSGRLNVRMEEEDHRLFTAKAAEEQKSLNKWILEKLRMAAML